MKTEETNNIISVIENENMQLSGKQVKKFKKNKEQNFFIINAIIIYLLIFLILILGIYIFFTKKNSNKKKGIENEDFRLSIYLNPIRKRNFEVLDAKKKKQNDKDKDNHMDDN